MIQRAGTLSQKAKKNQTDYNCLELGHAISDTILEGLRECRERHNKIFDEEEYCIVRQIAHDSLLSNLKRYKYFGFLYLPKPRPDQSVFLYNKTLDQFTKCLWVLPSAARMAQLASTSCIVPKSYERMQAWSVAFFKGTFWEYIRHEHNISMLSECEYLSANRKELTNACGNTTNPDSSESFDFSKINVNQIEDAPEAIIQ